MSQLQRISGTISELVISKGYADPVFPQFDKDVAGGVAIAAIAVGEFFSAAALANTSQGAEIDVEYFACILNKLPVFGHFYRVNFKNGDEIEFVIEIRSAGAVVVGARSRQRRLVWMLPYQTRGLEAQKKNNNKWRYIISLLCGAVSAALIISNTPSDITWPLWFVPANFLTIFLASLGISFVATRRFHQFSVQATEVFDALGYENASGVDLPALSKRAEKKWRMETTEPAEIIGLYTSPAPANVAQKKPFTFNTEGACKLCRIRVYSRNFGGHVTKVAQQYAG